MEASCVSVYGQGQHFCIVGLSRLFYIEMSHSVGEMKCQKAEHNFVGLKSHL